MLLNGNWVTSGGFYAGSQYYVDGGQKCAEPQPWVGLIFDNVYEIDKLIVSAKENQREYVDVLQYMKKNSVKLEQECMKG